MSALFFLLPIAREFGVGGLFFKVVFCALIMTCVYLVSIKRSQVIIVLLLSLPGIFMTLSTDSFEYSLREVMGLFSNLGLFAFVIYAIVGHIKSHTQVDHHIISGAVSIYLLIGLAWSFIYMIIELIQPGSFNGIYSSDHVDAKSISQVFNHLFYYSYVTLTTTGYGSIAPKSVIASAFSSGEAICGQLYMAIVIARLVSLYTTHDIRNLEKRGS
jgi:voltage-gated potassium channel